MWEIVNNDHNRHMLTGLIKKSECSKWMVQSETMIHVSFLFSFSAFKYVLQFLHPKLESHFP